jgi:guanyl-specific ribonuclease Sa
MVLKAFEGGSAYTSDIIEAMKKVARILSKIPFYDLKKLPQNVQAAFQRYDAHGWKGTPPGQSRNINAGGNYYNKDNYLPQVDKSGNPITYREFDVNTKDPVTGRDVERFVVGSDGSVYYTDSHYGRGASLRGLPPFVRIK